MSVIKQIADYHQEMVGWRRDIHAHPELGFEEFRTSALVAEKLEQWGIETHREIAGTGVVGVIYGKGKAAASIGLRADMDALPITENNDLDYRSSHAGKMHACGHDGHTTMLLGAARYLAETRNFDGVVNLIFQPAEENSGGAKHMIDEGLFERFPCDAVYGMHNYTEIPKNTFAINSGGFMAAADTVQIEIEGLGGHAALPHLCVDPIAIGVQLHAALQNIVSRNLNPTSPAVISITQFNAGQVSNVIPEKATLVGSVRTVDLETRHEIRQRLSDICDGIAVAHKAKISIDYAQGYPALVNHAEQTQNAISAAAAVVGEKNVDANYTPVMGAEDFSYMLEARPGAYIFIGQGDQNCVHDLHHPNYDFNDQILSIGASYWARLVEQQLPL
ncbi:MAG: amidohydrolase [Proteobacteria bacterium]|nr:amidohydrolase [Pseudomonadota bacterium]